MKASFIKDEYDRSIKNKLNQVDDVVFKTDQWKEN